MPVFEWAGVDAGGKSRKGLADAESERALRARLRSEGIFPTAVSESSRPDRARAPGEVRLAGFSRGIPDAEITIMTRLLANLLAAHIPLVESLTAIIDQVENANLKRVMSQVRDKVNEGESLSNALREHSRVFSPLYVNMVAAGETSGALEVVMNRLADFTEASMRLRTKVRGALAYPVFVLLFVTAIVAFLFVYVIPKVTKMLQDVKATLPFATKLLISISSFFRDWWWAVALGLAVLVLAFRWWVGTERGRRRFDTFRLHAPIFGPLHRMVSVARFAKTFATLLRSGVPVLGALDIVKNIVENVVLSGILDGVRESVREGESLATPLRRSGEFPPIVTHMIAVGERTGHLEEMLDHVSGIYEVQVESQLTALTSLLEPLIIVVMGGVVIFIVLAIMLPILNLTSSVHM